MLKLLEGFHHQTARQITGMTTKNLADWEWEYPPVVAALAAAGLHPIHEYIRIWQATIAEHIACNPIYKVCIEE